MQDLLACGQGEKARMDFIRAAIDAHRASDLYKTAVDAQAYYDGENPTISRYEKIIYDFEGRAHRVLFCGNHTSRVQCRANAGRRYAREVW